MKNFILIPNKNVKLPLSDDVVFPISINGGASSVNDFEGGNLTVYSKELQVVGSAVVNDFLRQFLDYSGGNENSDYLPTSKVNAVLFVNHEEVLSGVLLVKKCTIIGNEITYTVQIFNPVVDFLTSADKVMLSELDFDDLLHNFTLSEIQSTWNLTKKYYYGLVDKGYNRINQREMPLNSFALYTNFKYILTSIFKKFNVNFSSNFISNDVDFGKILFGYGGGEDVVSNNSLLTNSIIETSVTGQNDYLIMDAETGDYLVDTTFYLPTNVKLLSKNGNMIVNSDAGNQVNTPIININYNGTSEATITGEVVITTVGEFNTGANFNNSPIKMILYVGTKKQEVLLYRTSITAKTITYNFNKVLTVPNVHNGDDAYFEIATDQMFFLHFISGQVSYGVNVSYDLTFDLKNINTNLTEGSQVNPAFYLPEMTCADFFKGFVKTFAIEYEYINDVLILEPYDTFYNGRVNALEMTGKIDHSKPINFGVIQNDQPKRINFKLAENKDFESERYIVGSGRAYGDKTMLQRSFFATESLDVTLPFATVVSFKYSLNSNYSDLVIPRIMKVKETGAFEPQRGKPRICYPYVNDIETKKRVDIVLNAGITPLFQFGTVREFTPNYSLMWENPAVVFADVILPTKTLFSQFHNNRLNSFIDDEARNLTAYFRLTNFDLKNFDRRKLWKINGAFYRVVSIPDADPSTNATSIVNLIKMIAPRNFRKNANVPYLPAPFTPKLDPVVSTGDDGTNVVIYDGVISFSGLIPPRYNVYNFWVEGNWASKGITDELTFRQFLTGDLTWSNNDLENIVIKNLTITPTLIKCNLTAECSYLSFNTIEITNLVNIGDLTLKSGSTYIQIFFNECFITDLQNFNFKFKVGTGYIMQFKTNLLNFCGYILSEAWALSQENLTAGEVYLSFFNNPDSISGQRLEDILTAKNITII